MATRGIIAVYTGQGTWRGRYVHWDNYPHRIVPLLAELVERDGVAKVVDTIINKRESWSTIDTGEPRFELGYKKKNYEPGYGFFHSDGYMDIYTNDTGFYSWAQYVYVIDDDGVTVHNVVGEEPETLEPYGRYTWAEAKNFQPALQASE